MVADRVDASATETIAALRAHDVEAMKVIVDLSTFVGAQSLMTASSQCLRAHRCSGQQCWRHDLDQAIPSLQRRRGEARARTLALSHALVLPRGIADHDGAEVRFDRQSRLAIDARPLPPSLCDQQRRHPGARARCWPWNMAATASASTRWRPAAPTSPTASHRGNCCGPASWPRTSPRWKPRTISAKWREDIRNQQALQRRGLPEEQAAAIAFLASDDASFITGQVINCSGGQS